ncbi:RNA-binding S4 domain-containing protein [Anaerosphaera multitolerans]|uniref:RNA-binding S4 domain-containing protein n=1 Tax=Anaerosphaera multitolerans TaxID=2487351 RepID=A0A437SA30_9FIRM|nr:RNA-binding S4 domain-containing protein [Anaerosphaera multitolerans]RVU55741.1 RNA-binding S4 domain-containing protein [Anaerosphaera multitolerans]
MKSEDYIKLDSFLKLMGVAQTGGEAKIFITEGLVKVNGEIELRRGRKLYNNDKVEFEGEIFVVGEK